MDDKKQKTTLKQVAELSGFSPASVSMILNNRLDVSFSEDTVRRVKEAADKLGYSRKAEAQGRQRSLGAKLIAVLCPNISNPYYSTLVQSIEQAAWEKGFRILVFDTYRSASVEDQVLELLECADIGGLIFTILPQPTEHFARATRGLPTVVIGDKGSALSVDMVEMDNFSAGVLIARHLIELGHERIAYISTTLDEVNSVRLKRLQGIQETFRSLCPQGRVLVRSRSIQPEEELNDLHIEHRVGHELAKECLAASKVPGSAFEALSAFVAVNDMVAYGVIDAIREEGLSVPEDFSVCGIDNIFPSSLNPIALTTVDNYIVNKGHNAFSMLYAKIMGARAELAGREEGKPEVITRIEYPPRLIVRASTGRARGTERRSEK